MQQRRPTPVHYLFVLVWVFNSQALTQAYLSDSVAINNKRKL